MESLAVESKSCKACRQTKSLSEFYTKGKSGHTARCKECHNRSRAVYRVTAKEKVNAKKREHYERCRESYLAYNRSDKRRASVFKWKLEKQFGITVEQFDEMLRKQGGACAVCGRPPTEINGHRHKHRLHVDHDHATGRVRGLLCNSCNVAIGCLKDDIGVLYAAIDYLSYPKEAE